MRESIVLAKVLVESSKMNPKERHKGKKSGEKKGKGFARKGKLNEVYDSSHFFFFFLHCRTSARLGRSTTGVSL